MFDFKVYEDTSVLCMDEGEEINCYVVLRFSIEPDDIMYNFNEYGINIEVYIDDNVVEEYFIAYFNDYETEAEPRDEYYYADLCEQGIEYWRD